MPSLILDTDIGTDADDAIALAFALRHPAIDLRAVTTVAGDARVRAAIARKLLRLAGRDDVVVAAGVGRSGPQRVAEAWLGHEGRGLLGPGDADGEFPDGVAVLAAEAARRPIELVTVGPQTNIAAALARDPGFGRGVRRLTLMGGAFAPIVDLGSVQAPARDHNLAIDPDAAVATLNVGLPVVYVPLDVTAGTFFDHEDVARLRRGDALCRAVADLVDAWTPVLRELTGGAYPAERAVALHDPLAVACTVERSFVRIERLPVTVVRHREHVRTFVDPLEGTDAEVVTWVDVDALREFLLETLLAR